MKKTVCIFLAMLVIFSFSGCLKDDFEALEKEIEKIEEDIDDIKDDIDSAEEENEKLLTEVSSLESENSEINLSLESLMEENTALEEKIAFISDDGLGVDHMYFMRNFNLYFIVNDDSNFFDSAFFPYTLYEEDTLEIVYYLALDGELCTNVCLDITFANDKYNLKEITLYADEYALTYYSDYITIYLVAMLDAYIATKEEGYVDMDSNQDLLLDLLDGKALYNNTVQFYSEETSTYFIGTIKDISND